MTNGPVCKFVPPILWFQNLWVFCATADIDAEELHFYLFAIKLNIYI